MDTRYLNVDLEIQSNSDLSSLVEYFEGKVFFLWKDLDTNKSSICLETNLLNTLGPEEDIIKLLEFIEDLPLKLREVWASCEKKVMDIGFEAGNTQNTLDSFISVNTLQRVAQTGCAIKIRIYPYVARPENKGDIIVVNEDN